jgi:hypothetical protein
MVAINFITAGFCMAISFHSAKGSILEMNVRKLVVTLIYLRVPLFVCELVWTIASTILIFGIFKANFCISMYGIRIIVLLEWFLICTTCFGIFVVFNPHGGKSDDSIPMIERRYWRSRLTLCKIGQDQTMRAALDEIAIVIASFFADNDYVFSDIVAGLLLLVHSPHKRAPPEEENTSIKAQRKKTEMDEKSRLLEDSVKILRFRCCNLWLAYVYAQPLWMCTLVSSL